MTTGFPFQAVRLEKGPDAVSPRRSKPALQKAEMAWKKDL